MVFGDIDAPLTDISVHGAGITFELPGDYLHPVAQAESVVKTHRLQCSGLIMEHVMEGSGFAGAGARNGCQLVFANPISDLEATMIFHVKAQHDHQTCEGARRRRGEDVAPTVETERWLEGNDKVKVLTALGYISEHRYYAIVESDNYSDVNLLLQGHVFNGSVEILPCLDMMERRKDRGEWGK